mmetsp:Transcript_15344/g.47544  ORF Transcript_15344/g.47544 Transcript_15344/m.47544 type:complete len:309 (+) Transcript_15344:675-1601(+)
MRPALRGARRAPRRRVRRLHADDVRAPQGVLPRALEAVRGGGRHLPRALRRLVRRARGAIRESVRRAAPELLRRGRHCAEADDGRVLLLPPREVRARGPEARRDASGVRPARGAAPRRPQDVGRRGGDREAVDLADDVRLGRRAPGRVRRGPRHVRVDRRADELRHGRRVLEGGRRRRRRLRPDERRALARGLPRHRQRHRALPRHLLARLPHERGAGVAEGRVLPRLRPRRRRREDVQDAGQRRRPQRALGQRHRRGFVPLLLLQRRVAGRGRQVLRGGADARAQLGARGRVRQPGTPRDGARRGKM